MDCSKILEYIGSVSDIYLDKKHLEDIKKGCRKSYRISAVDWRKIIV
ncbi:MAG: hypothetical protein LUE96_07605 [Lachnospiraceae bacterium]|nr:hypothetical protein [Lachnospiraceae bacterium]